MCIFENTTCRKVCEFFSHLTWLFSDWYSTDNLNRKLICTLFIINIYYPEIYRILLDPNRTFCEFSIEILLLCHCIFATCLVLSWFCLVCSSSEFLYVQLVAVIVYAVCWLALYLWSRWTDWLAGAWIYGLHNSRLSLFAQFYANFYYHFCSKDNWIFCSRLLLCVWVFINNK